MNELPPFKAGLAQMDVLPGQPARNVERMLALIEEAKGKEMDLIAFPEMCVGGYLIGDRWLEDAFCRDLMEYNGVLRDASEGICVAYGNVYLDEGVLHLGGGWHPNKDGRTRKYNAVYVYQDGRPARRAGEGQEKCSGILPEGVTPKTLLPNYRIFDDERYFFSTQDVAKDFDGVGLGDLLYPFEVGVAGGRGTLPVGFEVCEDLWCADYRQNGKAVNPTRYLVEHGARLIVNVSASPWTYWKNNARDRRVKFLREDVGNGFVPFLYVNNVGAQNNGKNVVTFDGGSTAYNSRAEPVMFARAAYEEELLEVTPDVLALPGRERVEKPKIAQKYDAIVAGICHVRDILGWREHPRFVVGVSGGVDSSVVAALLVKAVGSDHVVTVNMPSRYNSRETRDAARHVAEALGVPYLVVPIEDICAPIYDTLEPLTYDDEPRPLSTLNRENIQAKVRGTTILSNLAAKFGGLFTNNGNKLEIALGYATLYGDVGGAIAPIGDLTKVEVFEMARFLNEEVFHREVVSNALIPDELYRFGRDKIAPTAELKDDQVDPMKFGYHDALLEAMTDFKKVAPSDVLRWYLEGTVEENLGVTTELLERWGLDDPATFVEDLEWFARLVSTSVFKRVQAPPIVITSKSSYGYDIRESQLPYRETREFARLKVEVRKMERYAPRTGRANNRG
ncbi:MAG: NAD(+) synthase [Promethearchaeota archaeon]